MRVREHSGIEICQPLTEPPEPGIEGAGVPRDRAPTSVLEPAGFLDINPSTAARAIEDLKRSGYRPLAQPPEAEGTVDAGESESSD